MTTVSKESMQVVIAYKADAPTFASLQVEGNSLCLKKRILLPEDGNLMKGIYCLHFPDQ